MRTFVKLYQFGAVQLNFLVFELVKNMVDEGIPLGSLWYSDYLDAR